MNISPVFCSQSCFSFVKIDPIKKLISPRGLMAHNGRLLDEYFTNPDIDANRTYLCYSLIKPEKSYDEILNDLLNEYHIKLRKDANIFLFAYISISPALEKSLGTERTKSFFRDLCTFVTTHLNKKGIISFDVHMDEVRPHAHIVMCPITEDGQLCTHKFLHAPKTKDYFPYFRSALYDYMHERYPELRRYRFDVHKGRRMVSVQTLKDSQSLVCMENNLREAMQLLTPENAPEQLPGILAVAQEIIMTSEDARSAVFSVNDHIKELEKRAEDLEKENDYLKSHIEDMEYVTNRHIDELSVVLPEMASRFHDRYKWYYVDPSESPQIENTPERQPALPIH